MLRQRWSSSKQIKLGALLSYISIAINIGAGVLYTPWLVKSIGQSDYGLYTLAGSLISLFMVDFGISSAVSRFISKYLAENRQDEVNGFLGIVYKLYFFIDIIFLLILVGVFFFLEAIYPALTADELAKFKVVFIIVSINNIVTFPFVTLSGILTSYELFFQLKLCTIFQKISVVVCMVIALLLNKGLYTLVTVTMVCNFLTTGLKYYYIKKYTPVKVRIRFWDKKILKSIFSFSIWSTIISIAERFIFNIMPSILAALSGALSVAIFGVSSTIEGYVYTFSAAINGMFLPKTSRILTHENKDAELLELMIRIGRINLTVVSLIIIGFACAGRTFMNLWMGTDYSNAYIIALLMILPDFVYAPQEIARTALVAENKIKYQAFVYIVIGVINIVLSLMLCPIVGEIGAGISIFVAYTVRLILMTLIYKRILGIDIQKFFYECHFKMLPALLISAVIGFTIFRFNTSGWSMLIMKCLGLMVAYLLVMWHWGFNTYEKELVTNTSKKIIRLIYKGDKNV